MMLPEATAVRLVPVLELMPAVFLSRNRAMPSPGASHEDWERYRSECDGDFARLGLQPVEPLSWHIPLAQLTDPMILQEILRCHCSSSDADAVAATDEFIDDSFGDIDSNGFEALPGGYALLTGGSVRFTPRCCGDLGDIREWRAAAWHPDPSPRRIWIGHPSLDVRFNGGHLLITEEEAGEEDSPCIIDSLSLRQAVDAAERGLLAFYDTLLPVVGQTFGSERAVEIAEILTGLRTSG